MESLRYEEHGTCLRGLLAEGILDEEGAEECPGPKALRPEGIGSRLVRKAPKDQPPSTHWYQYIPIPRLPQCFYGRVLDRKSVV